MTKLVEDQSTNKPLIVATTVKVVLIVLAIAGVGVLTYSQLDRNAASLFYSGHYKEAKEATEKALTQLKKEQGDQNPEYANELKNLARTYLAGKDYKQADEYFDKSIALFEKLGQQNNTDYASALVFYGDRYLDTHDYEKAEAYYRRGIAVLEKIAPHSNDLAWTYQRLGNLCHQTGRDAEWKANYTNASKILIPTARWITVRTPGTAKHLSRLRIREQRLYPW